MFFGNITYPEIRIYPALIPSHTVEERNSKLPLAAVVPGNRGLCEVTYL